MSLEELAQKTSRDGRCESHLLSAQESERGHAAYNAGRDSKRPPFVRLFLAVQKGEVSAAPATLDLAESMDRKIIVLLHGDDISDRLLGGMPE